MTTELLRPLTGPKTLDLRLYQTETIESLRVAARSGFQRIILCAPTGSGKCLGEGTDVLMADGREMPVELVGEGDRLMGPDGTPRRVQSITQGTGPMYRINPVKGDPWECNGDHILMLVRTGELDDPARRKRNRDGEIVEVTVNEWLTWSKWRKHVHKLYRVPVEFPAQNLPVHPYLLGVLLGDGSLTNNRILLTSVDSEIVEAVSWLALQHGVTCKETPSEGRAQGYLLSNDRGQGNPLLDSLRDLGIQECRSGDKFIPPQYMTASREQRSQLLAGLLDTDGHLSGGYFDLVVKSRELAEDTAYVARSLGLAAYLSLKQQLYRGEIRDYWRVTVSGEVSEIPTRIPRKRAAPRQQKKDVLRTGFSVESLGDDDYYGFTLDGDGQFLLGDFTVTHNTEMAIHLIQEAQRKGSRVTFVVDGISLAEQTSARLSSYGIAHGYAQGENTWGRHEKVQVAMAQTIAKREFWTNLDLLIIDECHIQRKAIQDFARQWGGRVIGLTATPIVKGLRETWETIVNATTTDALVAASHLAPVEIYAATEIDMSGAAKTAGEWTAGAVRERSGLIIGDIVSTWARYTSEHFGGPAKTLLFSADTAHGADLCQGFQAAGFDFRQSTYRDSNEVTTAMVEGFRRGDFTGLVSVAKFVKGFDVPDVLVGVSSILPESRYKLL